MAGAGAAFERGSRRRISTRRDARRSRWRASTGLRQRNPRSRRSPLDRRARGARSGGDLRKLRIGRDTAQTSNEEASSTGRIPSVNAAFILQIKRHISLRSIFRVKSALRCSWHFSLRCNCARARRARVERRDFVMAKLKALILAGGAFFALARAAAAADLLPPAAGDRTAAASRWSNSAAGTCAATSASASTRRRRTSRLRPTRSRRGDGSRRPPTNTFNNPTISAVGHSRLRLRLPVQQLASRRRDRRISRRRGLPDARSAQRAEHCRCPTPAPTIRRLLSRQHLVVGRRWSTAMSTWAPGRGITPYVGAGVGLAYNKLSGMTDTGIRLHRQRHAIPQRRLFQQRLQDEFRLGPDGGPRLQRHAEPEARSRLSLPRSTASSLPARRIA